MLVGIGVGYRLRLTVNVDKARWAQVKDTIAADQRRLDNLELITALKEEA